MTITTTPIRVTCADGVELGGMLLKPATAKAIVQFNAGTGAKKEFYLPFLEFLTQQGYLCCLWDYRGIGESAPNSLRGCDHRFQDYGIYDIPAITRFLTSEFPDLPLVMVGHSAGGQQVGFSTDLSRIKGLLGFAVSVGYLGFMPFRYSWVSRYFFSVFSPISIVLTGYVAAKRFGIMEDLPKNVVLEWRDWCNVPNYFFNERFYGKTVPRGLFQEYPFPVHVIWASDDPISNKRSIPMFWNHVKSAQGITFRKLDPKALGVDNIDHFGFFRKKFRENIWQEALDTLDGFII
jgi:predicted alpha/beta hydrolase